MKGKPRTKLPGGVDLIALMRSRNPRYPSGYEPGFGGGTLIYSGHLETKVEFFGSMKLPDIGAYFDYHLDDAKHRQDKKWEAFIAAVIERFRTFMAQLPPCCEAMRMSEIVASFLTQLEEAKRRGDSKRQTFAETIIDELGDLRATVLHCIDSDIVEYVAALEQR